MDNGYVSPEKGQSHVHSIISHLKITCRISDTGDVYDVNHQKLPRKEQPLFNEKGEWEAVIDYKTGVIKNWSKGVFAHIRYELNFKNGDYCKLYVYGIQDNLIYSSNCRVPQGLRLGCYGDDITFLYINTEGKIDGWEGLYPMQLLGRFTFQMISLLITVINDPKLASLNPHISRDKYNQWQLECVDPTNGDVLTFSPAGGMYYKYDYAINGIGNGYNIVGDVNDLRSFLLKRIN